MNIQNFILKFQNQKYRFTLVSIVKTTQGLENLVQCVWSQQMARPGLYANIHAKRKRGGKMRKKGAKGAPKASDFKRAKQTARKR